LFMLDKETYPGFHFAFSYLPYNRLIFEQLGVLDRIEAGGFTRKWGAQFIMGNGSKSLALTFRQGRFTREPMALQVERATFDHILLQHARESGADVCEGWTVTSASVRSDTAEVCAIAPNGEKRTFEGSFVVDASGRGNLTGNQEGVREIHPHHKKLAIFGHFAGVVLDQGDAGGDTVIIRFENKWFWLIPLRPGKVSIGCVLDQGEFARTKQTPEQVFETAWRSSDPLRQRMEGARLIGSLQVTSDFSYHNRRLVGPRLVRVGDAAGFMDPIFSAGVFLAMRSGQMAAELIAQALAEGSDGSARLGRYEKKLNRAMRLYWKMVEGFYTTPFIEVFLEPRHRFDLPAAVTAVLAGEIEGGWSIRWRLSLFFAVVRLQAWWPLVPRLKFN
jgi:flavin-dependent dehydrogenase